MTGKSHSSEVIGTARTYVVSGRILPERVAFEWPIMRYAMRHPDVEAKIYFCAMQSQIIMHVVANAPVPTSNIRNMCLHLAGNVVNAAGFFQVRSFSYDIETVTCLETGASEVFGVEGYVFSSKGKYADSIAFKRSDHGVSVSTEMLENEFFVRATFELRCAVHYPEYTALHCRLAIESIRNAFDTDDEANGWKALRDTLNVTKGAIESFRLQAIEQRHGRNLAQTWEDRRDCMQVAWEIVYRYYLHVAEHKDQPRAALPLL